MTHFDIIEAVYWNNTIASSFGLNFVSSILRSSRGWALLWNDCLQKLSIRRKERMDSLFAALSGRRHLTYRTRSKCGGKMSMECGQKRLRVRHVGSSNTHLGDVFGRYKMSIATVSSSYKIGEGVWQRGVLCQRSSDGLASLQFKNDVQHHLSRQSESEWIIWALYCLQPCV
jgi:hypothetical protein